MLSVGWPASRGPAFFGGMIDFPGSLPWNGFHNPAHMSINGLSRALLTSDGFRAGGQCSRSCAGGILAPSDEAESARWTDPAQSSLITRRFVSLNSGSDRIFQSERIMTLMQRAGLSVLVFGQFN